MPRMSRSTREFREAQVAAVTRFQEVAVEVSRVAFAFPKAQVQVQVQAAFQALLDLSWAIRAIENSEE